MKRDYRNRAFSLCLPVFANETKRTADREASFRGGPAHPGVFASRPLRRLAGVAWRFPTDGPVPAVRWTRAPPSRAARSISRAATERSLPWTRARAGKSGVSPWARTGDTLYAGCEDGHVFAFDAASGVPSFLAARAQDGAPSVVVFASDALPAEALDAGDGGGLRRDAPDRVDDFPDGALDIDTPGDAADF